MELIALNKVVKGLMDGLPDEVSASLEEVDVLVCESPADATKALLAEARTAAAEEGKELTVDEVKELTVPADCKGLFLGDPMEKTDDSDPDAEDSDVVYDPEGYMVLCASNIESVDAAVLVFLHEMGHALGLDEAEVKELGLAVSQATKEGGQNAREHQPNG